MALSLGSALATRVYLGATEINLAYFGATQVYTSSAFSAEAQDYFDRLDTAGDTTYVDYKLPLANYIDGLVTNGLWNGLLSAACFVGVGLEGVLVPLKSGMATITNSGFLAGDLDQLNGLKGDASSHIGTGVTKGDLTQNDLSMSVYLTQVGTVSNVQTFIGATASALIQLNASSNTPRIANSGGSFTDTDRGVGFYGASRDNSAGFDIRFKGTDYASTETSIAISGTDELSVFARAGASLFSDWGIGTYHIGTSVGAAGLITLETLQATLITEVAEAQFSAEAANYFGRLSAAGDSTYYAYRQPLANYIDGLVTLGGAYWDDMLSAASFVGVGIQGITVPLRAGMVSATNVNNNFVAGDLDQLTGLKANGSTKYINTGASSSNLALNDASVSVFVTELDTTRAGYFGANSTSGSMRLFGSATRQYGSDREQIDGNNVSALQIVSVDSLNGMSRDNASNFNFYNGADNTVTDLSTIAAGGDIYLFSNNAATRYSNPRIATYHVGPALDLATLDALQDTLIAEIAAI